jgi:uncharacterized protein with HEPN domain
MKRNLLLYLNDIKYSATDIIEFTKNLDSISFSADKKTLYAVIRALEIIGEATKKIPVSIKRNYTDIEWKSMAGLRDVLIHDYFGVNNELIWKLIQEKIPFLIKNIEIVINDYKKENPDLFD